MNSDSQLLREYSESRSEAAFAELVRRHLDFVYSAALRMVRDAHLAEDVTQKVFVALAANSRQLMEHPILLGWLHRTAQNLAAKIVRSDVRRRALEQEVVAMNDCHEPDVSWEAVAPHLDHALGELSDADRNAVLLRYFQRQSAREMAQTLGTTEDAAQKRVSRAVERLRELFAERGVTVGLGGLATVLSTHAVEAAPAGLGATISATASVTKLSAVAVHWMVAKTLAVCAGVAAVVLFVRLLVPQPSGAQATPTGPSSASGTFSASTQLNRAGLPIRISNASFSGLGDVRFLVEVDPKVKRIATSDPAGHIKSLIPVAGRASPDFLRLYTSRFTRVEVTNGSPVFGKRIRISGWMKTSAIENWTGFGCLVQNEEGRLFAVDEMMDRPVHGTSDWKQLQLVMDVPAENCVINIGTLLYGTGEVWADDVQIDVVSTNTATTDDRRWHKWSPNAPDYSVGLDPETPHDGHPSLRLAYTPDGRAPRGSWMWWGQCIREPEKYAGHTVRMTVWVKCEDASGTAGINLRPKGPNFQLLAEDKKPRRHITGTTDWVQRSIFCAIPKETQCLDTGFYFNGSGKIWIDMESLKYEISDDEVPVP